MFHPISLEFKWSEMKLRRWNKSHKTVSYCRQLSTVSPRSGVLSSKLFLGEIHYLVRIIY